METLTLRVPKSTPATFIGPQVSAGRGPALLMHGYVPVQVVGGGFVNRASHGGHVGGYVVLEAFFADEAEEFLEVRNAHDARSSEGVEGVVGEFALAYIAGYRPFEIV